MKNNMDLKVGTPKTLDEAIERMVTMPASHLTLKEGGYHTMRDYLSQKFGVAYMKAEKISPEAFGLIADLWQQITQREKK